MWTSIGLNCYFAPVEENGDGIRRVFKKNQWILEPEVFGLDVARVRSVDDIHILIDAMLDEEWLSHFPSLLQLYSCYRRKMGETVSSVSETDVLFQNFKKQYESRRAEWMSQQWAFKLAYHRTLSDYEIQNKTACLGVQWGLGELLLKTGGDWWETGCETNTDASTWCIPNGFRKIESYTRSTSIHAPESFVLKGLPVFPKHGNLNTVLWVTQGVLQQGWNQKILELWLESIRQSNNIHCVVVTGDAPAWALLPNEKKRDHFQQCTLVTQNKIYHVYLWNAKTIRLPQSWEEWTSNIKQNNISVEKLIPENDKVPYISHSGESSDAFASYRLSYAMEHALTDLEKRVGGIPEWICSYFGGDIPKLREKLSAEQCDAVALGLDALQRKVGMILADETGFGKGRILAALTHIAVQKKIPVIFISENKQLFSDFYRDLDAVGAVDSWGEKLPLVLHKTATVYTTTGEVKIKALTEKKYEEMLSKEKWEQEELPVIFTTYAQINRKAKENKKLDWLKARAQGAWLILDEAHNTAGNSNTFEHMQELLEVSAGVLYSSATFAKNEGNLDIYQKAIPVNSGAFSLLKKVLGDASEAEGLRELLASEMAMKGNFIRREHSPIAPPTPIWIKMEECEQQALAQFSEMWQSIFYATESWEKVNGQRQGGWIKLGAALSRSIREFSMLLKMEPLALWIKERVQANEKVVVAVEYTLESALLEAHLGGDGVSYLVDESGDPIKVTTPPVETVLGDNGYFWKSRWLKLLDKVAPQEDLFLSDSDASTKIARLAYQQAKTKIEALPNWGLSPLDEIQSRLKGEGISVGEISGRTWSLIKEKETGWVFKKRPEVERTKVVHDFNHRISDVLFLTRAGCAGISVHAGKTFLDQRKRNLVEWDIAANPTNRVQFWGRVRRRDQVCEPSFWGIALDTTIDRRILERENRKKDKLLSHGGSFASKEMGLISKPGEAVVVEWIRDNPVQGRRLGIMSEQDTALGRVEKALARSIILPQEEQRSFLEKIVRGVEVGKDWYAKKTDTIRSDVSLEVRRQWWWGNPESWIEPSSGLSLSRVDVVERVWLPPPLPKMESVLSELSQAKTNLPLFQTSGGELIKYWDRLRKVEKEAGMYSASTDLEWATSHLHKFVLGCGVYVTRPGYGDGAWALFLGFDVPTEEGWGGSVSSWTASQIAMRLWIHGDSESVLLPLSVAMKDKQFYSEGVMLSGLWFQQPPTPKVGLCLEGNAVFVSYLGKKMNMGGPIQFVDKHRGRSTGWGLPLNVSWEDFWNLPREFVNASQVVDCLKKFDGVKMLAAVKESESCILCRRGQEYVFQFTNQSLLRAQETWLDFGIAKKLAPPRWNNEEGKVERGFSASDVYSILYGLENRGVEWKASLNESQRKWYEESSQYYFQKMVSTPEKNGKQYQRQTRKK